MCLCWDARAYAARGVVDGYGLLHELLADVMEDLVDQVTKHNEQNAVGSPGRGPSGDSWTMVSSAASDICQDNGKGEELALRALQRASASDLWAPFQASSAVCVICQDSDKGERLVLHRCLCARGVYHMAPCADLWGHSPCGL